MNRQEALEDDVRPLSRRAIAPHNAQFHDALADGLTPTQMIPVDGDHDAKAHGSPEELLHVPGRSFGRALHEAGEITTEEHDGSADDQHDQAIEKAGAQPPPRRGKKLELIGVARRENVRLRRSVGIDGLIHSGRIVKCPDSICPD